MVQLMVCSHFLQSYAAVPVICKNNAWAETIDGLSTITYLKVPCKVVHHQNQAASFNYRCVHPPIFSGLGRNLWRVLEWAVNLPALTLKAVSTRVIHLWEKNVRNRFSTCRKARNISTSKLIKAERQRKSRCSAEPEHCVQLCIRRMFRYCVIHTSLVITSELSAILVTTNAILEW